MKVLSYIEMNNPQGTYKRKDMLRYFGDKTIYEFYSQPFRPEIILELFEGWEYSIYGMLYNKKLMSHLGKETMQEKNVRTLDDFITDCQRAGIELEWKEVK